MGRTSIDADGQRVSWLNVYRRADSTLEIGNLYPERYWLKYALSNEGNPLHLRIRVKWKMGSAAYL